MQYSAPFALEPAPAYSTKYTLHFIIELPNNSSGVPREESDHTLRINSGGEDTLLTDKSIKARREYGSVRSLQRVTSSTL